MSILRQSRSLVNRKFLPHVKPKHKSLFLFGIKAFSLRSFRSLNSNARIVIPNRHTAESKVYRLVSKKKFTSNFLKILGAIKLVTKSSFVSCDFSSFCGFETLAFGVQTMMGRSIPIYANALTYPITENTSQNLFIIKQIKILASALGFYPRLVFDRGFAIPHLVRFLTSKKAFFYIRIKEGKRYQKEEGISVRYLVKNAKVNDFTCFIYDAVLRIVVSDKPENGNPPWYIVTSDFDSSREEIIKTYYWRFEIEETFKDLKHIYDLKGLQIKKIRTFITLLWFSILGFWMMRLLRVTNKYAKQKFGTHSKKALSLFRMFFETIQLEMFSAPGLGWELFPSSRPP